MTFNCTFWEWNKNCWSNFGVINDHVIHAFMSMCVYTKYIESELKIQFLISTGEKSHLDLVVLHEPYWTKVSLKSWKFRCFLAQLDDFQSPLH